MSISRPNTNYRTKQVVYSHEAMQPYVGFENMDSVPDGWRFDIKRWCSFFDLRLPTIPRLADASTQGVLESEYFKPGVGSVGAEDLEIKSIEELYDNNERLWIPLIENGYYYDYKTQFFYYSDNSRIEYIDPDDNKNGRNYIELAEEPDMNSPILAATFKRDWPSKRPLYHVRAQQMHAFSGLYQDGEELETVSPVGKITWDNVDTTKREFIVDSYQAGKTILRFNRDFTRTYGVIPSVIDDLAACQILGMSTGVSWQVFYLTHFPVLADDSFHLYVASSSSWEEWTRVDTWWELINSDSGVTPKLYFVDKDMGIVYFGSGTAGSIPPLGSAIVATYTTTLRIEYEEADQDTRVTAWAADVSPISQHINQGFVCITHDQIEAATIVLDIDKPAIAFTNSPIEYGPIYCGSDYAVLRATVKSSDGTAVPNKEVTFRMSPSTIGFLGGSTSTSSVTDGQGEAYASYQPPSSADTMGIYTQTMRASNKTGYVGTHKDLILNITDAGLEGLEDSIYLYQILKDDVILAYDNISDWIDENLTPPTWVVDSETETQWKSEVTIEYALKNWHDVNGATGVKPDGSQTGRKVVVYQIDTDTDNYDASAIHPVTGETGAIVPVRPSLVEKITDEADAYYGKWRAIYPNGAVPDCSPTSSSNNIGGYWLVSTRLVEFQAECWSQYYNRTIYSNKIVARVSLPDYLLGEYINSLLQKIPFGWKLPTDTDSVAAGLDGATFITVNPYADAYPDNNILFGPYGIIDLVNSNPSEDWASAPFQSVGFTVGVGDPWEASTSYSVGDIVLSTAGYGGMPQYLYQCSTAGVSGAAEPVWDTTVGLTTADNTVVWTRI